MGMTFQQALGFSQGGPKFESPPDITAGFRANREERSNEAFKRGLTANDTARVGIEQQGFDLKKKAYSDEQEQGALNDYYHALATEDPSQIKIALDRLKSLGMQVSGDVGTEKPGAEKGAPIPNPVTAAANGPQFKAAAPAAPEQTPAMPQSPPEEAQAAPQQLPPGQDAAGKKLPGFLAPFAPGYEQSEPQAGRDVSGKKLPSFLAPFAPTQFKTEKVDLDPTQFLTEKVDLEESKEPPVAEAKETKEPSTEAAVPLAGGDMASQAPGAHAPLDETSLITVKRKDGSVLSSLDPKQIRTAQGEAVGKAFAPFIANAATPEERNAAKMAANAAVGRIGTMPLNDVIEYGWKVYQFQLGQENKTVRAQFMGKQVNDKAAERAAKQEENANDDDAKAFEYAGTQGNANVGKAREKVVGAQKAIEGLNSGDPLAQVQAIQQIVKMNAGANPSDNEFDRVAQANGLPQKLEQVMKYVSGDGRYSGDPDYLRQVADVLQRGIQGSNQWIKGQALHSAQTYLSHPSPADPDYRLATAANLYSSISGESVSPDALRKFLPKRSATVLSGKKPAGGNKQKEADALLGK